MFFQNEKQNSTQSQKSAKILWEAVAMLVIGFICTPAGSFANDYTWPPRENAPVLTLLGPVYETDLELESELTVILADSLKKLANSPECCLPESCAWIYEWYLGLH